LPEINEIKLQMNSKKHAPVDRAALAQRESLVAACLRLDDTDRRQRVVRSERNSAIKSPTIEHIYVL
jgi:hypothetical protein